MERVAADCSTICLAARSDFAFQHLSDWNLFDSILPYVAANPGEFPLISSASYSTLGSYFDALHAANAAGNVTFPERGV